MFATIISVKRINHSVNGNPNFEFELLESDNAHAAITGLQHGDHTVERVTRRTQSDIGDSYGIIPNQAKEGTVMAYKLTKSGRISSVEKVSA